MQTVWPDWAKALAPKHTAKRKRTARMIPLRESSMNLRNHGQDGGSVKQNAHTMETARSSTWQLEHLSVTGSDERTTARHDGDKRSGMTTSDWITITFSLVAVVIGAGVSFALFRTQLLTDSQSLRDSLTVIDQQTQAFDRRLDAEAQGQQLLITSLATIEHTQSQILERMDLAKQIDDNSDLAEIRSTVERIDTRLHDAVRNIVGDVKEQQAELAAKIQRQFEHQSREATQVVREAFVAEVKKFVTDTRKQDKLVKNLVDSFMEGLRTMGQYQKTNIEGQSETSLNEIEQSISESINQVLDEVVDLKGQLIGLPQPNQAPEEDDPVARIG
ncbi:MAG: hypothetical protein AAFU85_31960 [Planctomycetota bacterium]